MDNGNGLNALGTDTDYFGNSYTPISAKLQVSRASGRGSQVLRGRKERLTITGDDYGLRVGFFSHRHP